MGFVLKCPKCGTEKESHVIGQTASANIKVDGPATVLVIKGNQVKKSKGKRRLRENKR